MNFNPSSAPVRIPQNIPARESARALLALRVPREFDIARLRPHNLPRAQRFETEADARARRDTEHERFERITGLAHVANLLFQCEGESPCAEAYCPSCGRLFRRWLTGQALRLQADLDLEVITVALELVPTQMLPDCGIEAEYLRGDDAFLVHAHLLVSRLPRDELKALRSAFADIDVARAVKVQAMRDPAAQISYLLKFTTYHRPGSQNGSRRPTAIPLPDHALKQLTLWRARHGFLDFVLMMGLRRSGGDLVRIENRKA